ncbi:methionine adenosyltransferase [Streptomyces fuscichromogenes]|uniref:S-adenosylmethionine synthetase n=1 Tax=Streptomyces fuscichromogenes TaxID=1324013 RepID=A0A917UFD9_9ACTN|nr:methionine adenosyltransferase [Streptomyces fuscichromogenes]GGM88840.1 S-adenosylmethionine synthetase [Streptomyces fuscichromogenes]
MSAATTPHSVSVYADHAQQIEELPYELVERKGIGHPDTMCDAIAERASQLYSQYCLEHFGRVAHHWFDKVMIFGGEAHLEYGRGELTNPYTVLFAGKGAYRCGDQPIPLEQILRQAAAEVLDAVSTGFDADRHLVIDCRIVDHQGAGRRNSRYRPQSADDLIAIGDPGLVSNDTNLLHAYAPFSRLEQAVLDVERFINGPDFKGRNADTGWDVKVFGSRSGEAFNFVVNMPFLAGHITSFAHYLERKKACQAEILALLTRSVGIAPTLTVNPTDRNGLPYLTALGSVADTGDVGAVGRGNRVTGLITPMRSMSIEAPAGKNPLDHTGKLYGVLARQLAVRLHDLLGKPVETHIFTSKEAPLNRPDEVVVRVHGLSQDPAEEDLVRKTVDDALADTAELTREIIVTGVTMW